MNATATHCRDLFYSNIVAKCIVVPISPSRKKEQMISKPTIRTAALAGLWTSLAAFPLVVWAADDAYWSGLVAWLVVAAIFIFVPAVYFVIGPEGRGFGRDWINDPAERIRYFALVKRVLVWAATAVVAGALILLVNNRL